MGLYILYETREYIIVSNERVIDSNGIKKVGFIDFYESNDKTWKFNFLVVPTIDELPHDIIENIYELAVLKEHENLSEKHIALIGCSLVDVRVWGPGRTLGYSRDSIFSVLDTLEIELDNFVSQTTIDDFHF